MEKTKGKDEDKDEGGKGKAPSRDESFREFRRVCSNVADVDAYTDKTAIIRKMFTRGAQGGKYLVVLINDIQTIACTDARVQENV